MYNVLWFDDEFASLPDILESAHLSDITLLGVSNSLEGIKLLQESYIRFDAVIVDGLFYQNPNQSGDISTQNACMEVARALDELKHKKEIPWFILSGQPSFTIDANLIVNVYKKGKVYDKVNTDLNTLWQDLKDEVDQLPDTQILRQHEKAFSFLTDEYLGEKYKTVLLQAIKLCAVTSGNTEQIRNSFVPLRKIMEQLFGYLTNIKLIPGTIYSASGSFNPCSLYLSGLHSEYKIKEGLVPPIVGFLLKQVTQVTQDASHDVPGKLKLHVDEFVHLNQTNYLYQSTVYQLLELLVWFKKFSDEQKESFQAQQPWTISSNTKEVVEGDWIKGEVVRIAPNGYGTFQPEEGSATLTILPKFVNGFALQEKDIILVAVTEGNDKQKLHIKDIQKI